MVQQPAPVRGKKRAPARKTPIRTCEACRTKRPQNHLVRLVRTSDGTVQIDRGPRKRLPGRGAYLCPAQECWRLARTRKSLDHAFEVQIPAERWQEFDPYIQNLPEAKMPSVADPE